MIFDTINKRQHVYQYDKDNIPTQELIKDLLHKAWQATPSKQNMMPYHVNVLGPTQADYKTKIYNKVVGNDKKMSEHNEVYDPEKFKLNPDYEHVLENPYLILFSQRVCNEDEINAFYKRRIENYNHFMEQCDPKWTEDILGTTGVEIGMFAQNLSSLCLEKDLYFSFCTCFNIQRDNWIDIPFVKNTPLLLMSIGYPKIFRRQRDSIYKLDKKTALDNVVKFIA